MNIQFASDLHLEVGFNLKYFTANPIKPHGDILVLAGDIMCWCGDYLNHPFWDWASRNFKQVIVVPGNHEFYKDFDLAILKDKSHGLIRENVTWHYNETIVIGGIQFICTTLWSHVPKEMEERYRVNLNDFGCIKLNGKALSVEDYNRLNKECVDFLEEELKSGQENKIVVSHHLPVFDALPAGINLLWSRYLYGNDLNHLLTSSFIKYWICGHLHETTPELRIGNTKVIMNPLGYVKKKNELFDDAKCISV